MKEWVVIGKIEGGGRFGREKGKQDLEYLTLNKNLAVFHIVKEVFLKLNFVMF